MSKLNDNVLEKMNKNRNGKVIMFKIFKTEISCTMDRQALVELLSFLQAARNNSMNLALFTYRKENFECLLNCLKPYWLYERFMDLVNKMETFEEMVKEKALWLYVNLEPLNVYLKAIALNVPTKNSSCKDLAELLMRTSAN